MKITIVCDVLGEENNGTTLAAMNLIRALMALFSQSPNEVQVGQRRAFQVTPWCPPGAWAFLTDMWPATG